MFDEEMGKIKRHLLFVLLCIVYHGPGILEGMDKVWGGKDHRRLSRESQAQGCADMRVEGYTLGSD